MGDWLVGICCVVAGTILVLFNNDPILRFFQVIVAWFMKLFFKNWDDTRKKNDEKKICRCFHLSPKPEELSQAMWDKLAGHALEDYRQKRGVVLNLHGEVAAIHSWSIKRRVWAFHFHFQAKPEDDDSPKTMFAEVFWYSLGKSFLVTFCGIMDPTDPDLGMDYCSQCGKGLLHPKGIKFFQYPPIENFPTTVDTPLASKTSSC